MFILPWSLEVLSRKRIESGTFFWLLKLMSALPQPLTNEFHRANTQWPCHLSSRQLQNLCCVLCKNCTQQQFPKWCTLLSQVWSRCNMICECVRGKSASWFPAFSTITSTAWATDSTHCSLWKVSIFSDYQSVWNLHKSHTGFA